MNEALHNFSGKELTGRDSRLWKEWKELDALCDKRKETAENPYKPSLSYIIRKKNARGLPTEYEIWFRTRSIVGVADTSRPRAPIFGDLHKMSIILPNNYPAADGNPIFKFRTKVWHPNIRYEGNFAGQVCLTIKEMGVMASLKDLVLRVERYLKYQLYHAKNIYPYPEDPVVAEWVREEAEPNGWTNFTSGKPSVTPQAPQEEAAGEEVPKPKQRRVLDI